MCTTSLIDLSYVLFSDIAIFVLKEDVKLQLTHLFYVRPKCDLQNFDFTIGLE